MSREMTLSGRVCLVTGATSGHGRALARALARLGAEVVLLGRDRERCLATQRQIEAETGRRSVFLVCDLSRRAEIDRAAADFFAAGRPLHVLINNAGLVNRTRRVTPDGVEETFAVNYLAQFQLSLRLLDGLRRGAPARIVNVASDVHRWVSLDLDDLDLGRGYSWWRAYGRSKLAVVYFTLELARRLAGKGVVVNAVDPGPLASNIAMNNRGPWVGPAGWMIKHLFPSAERAAATALWMATSPRLAEVSGAYFKYKRRRAPRIDRDDPGLAARLWQISARMTGVDM